MPDQTMQLTGQLTQNDAKQRSILYRFSKRVLIRSILYRPHGVAVLSGHRVLVGGWVKTGRKQGGGSFAFFGAQRRVVPCELAGYLGHRGSRFGAACGDWHLRGRGGCLKIPPEGTRQKIELRVEKVSHVGAVDPSKYPLPKTRLTLEFLTDFVHLRQRTNTIAAIARIRNALSYATHTFFKKHWFLYVHTPIITTSDCEGAGEMFQVTALISVAEKVEKDLIENPPLSEADIEAAKLLVKEKRVAVTQVKSDRASKEEISVYVAELTKAKENLSKLEERFKLKPGIPRKDGKIDFGQDFFARQAFLTVSGQLQVESYACAVGSVYTFGPTFRAEHSHTSRHLAEFWMVEPELAFADIEDDMNCAEAYVRFMCQWLLDNCLEDMKFMAEKYDKSCINCLKLVSSTPFERITYTEAVELLLEAVRNGKTFENEVKWGIDLASEHERYLTGEVSEACYCV